jgi:murein DD-endopeptidase MepM/ murein hydrolase activator NlpD
VSQGFDFYDGEVGVPVPYGAPVIAATSGTLERVDDNYSEMSPETFTGLLTAVADGATEDQLDLLRGRQIWVRGEDGRLMRYAHLSSIRDGLAEGQTVFRGQVIGYVGNSGTDAGVAGTTQQARLHFEIWDDASFFGEDLDADAVRFAAASVFTGP